MSVSAYRVYHLQWYCIPSAPRYNPPDMSHLQWYTVIPSTMVHKCTGYCGTHHLLHPGISHRISTIYGGTHMSHLQWYIFLTADSGQGRIKYQLQWYSVIPSTVVHKCTVYGGTHLPLHPDISRVKCTIYGGTQRYHLLWYILLQSSACSAIMDTGTAAGVRGFPGNPASITCTLYYMRTQDIVWRQQDAPTSYRRT